MCLKDELQTFMMFLSTVTLLRYTTMLIVVSVMFAYVDRRCSTLHHGKAHYNYLLRLCTCGKYQ